MMFSAYKLNKQGDNIRLSHSFSQNDRVTAFMLYNLGLRV